VQNCTPRPCLIFMQKNYITYIKERSEYLVSTQCINTISIRGPQKDTLIFYKLFWRILLSLYGTYIWNIVSFSRVKMST
jgi:hypothetical protein